MSTSPRWTRSSVKRGPEQHWLMLAADFSALEMLFLCSAVAWGGAGGANSKKYILNTRVEQ